MFVTTILQLFVCFNVNSFVIINTVLSLAQFCYQDVNVLIIIVSIMNKYVH